jgi:hypothetical protein
MRNNIDYRLDLYNAVDKFNEEMDKDIDSLLILCANSKQETFSAQSGNWENIADVLTAEKFPDNCTEEELRSHKTIKGIVVGLAIAICLKDKQLRDKAIQLLTK